MNELLNRENAMYVLILSYYDFPDGDAGSQREYAIGKLLANMGHTVFFIGMGNLDCYKISEYKGFQYTSLRINQNDSSLIKRLENYFGYKLRLKRLIQKYVSDKKIDYILVVDIPINALFFIKRLAKKNHIRLLHDAVEWYSPEQFKLRQFAPSYILKDLNNRFFIDKNFVVIAISKYLEEHFKSRGIDTVRIPVIMDVESINYHKITRKEKLVILYAGSPGKKDYLKEIIEGLALLDSKAVDRIDFKILGINKKQLVKECGISESTINKLNKNLTILGRVTKEEVLKNLEETDFTVLLRSPTQRYAKAGFPTKVVESLTNGTPVICNITSDLKDYICDGENGIIVDNCSAEAFAASIKRVLDFTFEKRKSMYEKSRKSAEDYFDYRLFKKIFDDMLN